MTKTLAEEAVDRLQRGEDMTTGHNRDFSKEHIDRALAEYRTEFPQMCRELAITHQMIAQIDPSVIMAVILLRMWRVFTSQRQLLSAMDKNLETIMKQLVLLQPKGTPQ